VPAGHGSDDPRRAAEPLLSLAHLTVLDAHPLELIDAAAAAGFAAVGLRIVPPMPTDAIVPVIGDAALIRRLNDRLRDTGLRVLDIEAIWLGPQTEVAALEPALATGRQLGARCVLAVGNDPEASRVVDNFARLAELAAGFELAVGLEFIPYCCTATLGEARRIIAAAAQPNTGVLLDALHLVRSGGSAAELELPGAAPILYSQICDARGPRPATIEALRREARAGRYYPGEGELPLAQILRALPAQLPIAVEAPCAEYAALPVAERARRCAAATGAFLESCRIPGADPSAR